MSIYHKHAPDATKVVDLYYDVNCVYWYKYEAFGNLSVDYLGKIFHVNFLIYAHWFMSIRISHIKDYSISVDKARYYTYIVDKYLDTSIVQDK